MRIKPFSLRIDGDSMMAFSAYLSIFYLCLPIAMIVLNSLLIRGIIVLTVFGFLTGLILKQKWKWLAAFCILFGMSFLYWCVTWRPRMDSFVYPYYCFSSLSFVFTGMYFWSSKNDKMLKRLFIFMTAIFFVTAITSLIGLSMYPLAAREMARGAAYDKATDISANKTVYRKLNIASWSQIYGMVFTTPTALMVWKRTKKKLFLLMPAVMMLATVLSQITFAALLTVFMVFALFLNKEKSAKQLILIVFLLLVSVVVLVKIDFFLTMAIKFFDGIGLTFLHSKLNDLRVLLTTGESVGDAESRSTLYFRSIKTFLESPLFGFAPTGEIATKWTVGYHSEFCDMLATFGILGILLIAVFMLLYFRVLMRIREKTLTVVYIGFLALFLFNPVLNSPQMFVGAFLYPLLALRYCRAADATLAGIPVGKLIRS